MDWRALLESIQDTQIRVYDVVDIGIVAFLLYRFFVLIEGTLAFQMILGLGLLLLTSYAADLFELYTLNWLLRNFWSIWVLALVILFQPELRRVLAQVGQQGLFRRGSSGDGGSAVIDEVVQAARELAASKTGALMVFERNTGLRLYREIGVELNADVSADLLKAIFNPAAPLHDGAAIISASRLAAAACFLPLTKTPHGSTTFGTRHRAALGVSEETDAVAVVVSEETGNISVAVNGKLVRELEPETLRKILQKLLHLEQDPKKAKTKAKKAKVKAT